MVIDEVLGNCAVLYNPESTEESWYLCRSVGEGRGKVAVRV